jgi:hypothetical protein
MSFQQGKERERESMGGGQRQKKPLITASTAIDPKPLPTCPRGDDIPVEA